MEQYLHLAAVEVPLPAGVDEAAKRIVADGGVTGAFAILFAFACAALLVILLRQRAAFEASQTKRDVAHEERVEAIVKAHEGREAALLAQIEAQHEKRFTDMRQVLDALNGNTGALNVISQTQADRASSSKDMGEALREILILAKANGEVLRAVHTIVLANASAIDRLTWHGGVVRAPAQGGGA